MYVIILIAILLVVAIWMRRTLPNRDDQIFVFASFGDRFFADLMDCILALIVALPFWYLIDKLIFNINFWDLFDETSDKFGIANYIIIILFIYNMTYLVGKYGQSWGRRVFEIKVVDYSGNSIGFWRSLIRNILAISLSSIFYLGFLWILWDKERQAWHDKIMKTYVIVVPK